MRRVKKISPNQATKRYRYNEGIPKIHLLTLNRPIIGALNIMKAIRNKPISLAVFFFDI
jgi:hypothetical protein